MVAKSVNTEHRPTSASDAPSISHIYAERVGCAFLGLAGIVDEFVSSKANGAFAIGEDETAEGRN